ncbi:succinylglutamate desuccinylase/aspartoacylase family protein [Bradyrhizobium sp. BEA-2-5]|uniref:succinylglutamate desuccinylase/aspartoacylase family protein n=1 Tax=Bradyrhizobium sp. BEA-2-5 TaxID=3080015 RepID=UPI00293E082C|nr:succinylglutamate desuccinylase/aspartoacylase family protein [Bradyrhizobium sp. BEA-2-5]WOH80338.1 succinylglutamate desuccinylase/aspartoacylase family protein [Bradyrhizobium sp. BEA-2-5]
MKSRVWTTIDFETAGIQSDFARVPYSSDTSAYGWLPVPMLCFKGEAGPTALLTAGTHGDEYEGQVALRRLARDLSTTKLNGRVIILPALNHPAVRAGRRNSPLDGGNLNRLFPGTSEGGPTAMIAHFVATELFPLADLVIDLHSGGSSLDYLPLALAHPGRSESEKHAVHRLLTSFAAPYSLLTDGAGGGAGTTLYAAAEQRGIPAITTELGRGATLWEAGLSIAEGGLRRVLRDYGLAPDIAVDEPAQSRFLQYQGPSASIYAPCDGLFEPLAKPGDCVEEGHIAGLIHPLDHALATPVELRFATRGIVAFRRFLTLTSTGDALFGLAAEPAKQ